MSNNLSVQSISPQYFSDYIPQITIPIQLPKIDFQEIFSQIAETANKASDAIWQFRDHAIAQLGAWDKRLDVLMPNFPIQTRIDQLVEEIEKTFAPLVEFNNWLNSNGHGSWYEQLAVCLAKLPFRAARNIIQQLYSIIKGVVYGATHPLKALNKLAELLVVLPFELTKPETLSQIGAGIVGSSLGEATIMGGFTSLIGLGIGGALIISGASIGSLRAFLQANEKEGGQAVARYLLGQAEKLSETTITSFYVGLITAAIRRAIQENQQKIKQKQEQSKPLESKNEEKITQEKSPDFFEVVGRCRNNSEGYPPIAYAVKLGRHDVVKFLIDNGESVNATTSSFPLWDWTGWEGDTWRQVATQPGLTPLELAIQNNDAEMVRILTSYSPTNYANISFSKTMFLHTQSFDIQGVWGDPVTKAVKFDDFRWGMHNSSVVTSPLTQALNGGNKEIIECLIKSYQSPQSLLGVYEQIRATGQESLMRLWLERQAFLVHGIPSTVTDETVKFLLSESLQQAISTNNTALVKQYLDSGWLLSKADVLQIFATKNPQLIEVVGKTVRFGDGVNPIVIATEAGAVDIVKTYIQQGVSFDRLLLHAVQEKHLEVVKHLLELPLSRTEIGEAYIKAYQIQAYDILKLLDAILAKGV